MSENTESKEKENRPSLAGVLAALTRPQEQLSAAAGDPGNLEQVCCLVDDEGPNVEREGARLAVAGMVTADSRLKDRFTWMLEDARVLSPYCPRGVTVYECRWTRGLVLGLVAAHDADAAAEIAAERKILWPDLVVWENGLPKTPGAALATFLNDIDDKKVAALGQEWLDSGLIPESLAPSIRDALKVLVDMTQEMARQEEAEKAEEEALRRRLVEKPR